MVGQAPSSPVPSGDGSLGASASITKRVSLSGGNFSLSMGEFSNNEGSDDLSAYSRGPQTREEEQALASTETKAVNRLRLAVFFVLVSTATVVCILAYKFTSNNEENDFVTAFTEQANRVVDGFQINAKRRVAAIEAFATSITSHAIFSNSTWPEVTLPDFERRGRATSEIAEVMSMILVPLVTDDTRKDWEAYSVANQGWLEEGIIASASLAKEREEERDEIATSQTNDQARLLQEHDFEEEQFIDGSDSYRILQRVRSIPEEIYRLDGLKAAPENGPGPYLPQWQISPAVPVASLVNFNLLSHLGYRDSLMAVLDAQIAVVGRSFEFNDPRDEQAAGRREVFNLFLQNWIQDDNVYEEDPVADVHVPVYSGFEDKNNRELVALLTCVVYWRTYFVNILPENAIGVTVILENSCEQKYTYQINGPSVVYVGPGDQHDTKYDDMEIGTSSGAFLQVDKVARDIDGSCLYSIRVYPSQDMEALYISTGPAIYTIVLVFIFMFTSGVFVLYDCLVERRQRVVMNTAVASTAIVSSLFPKNVRDRLYNQDGVGVEKPGSSRTSGGATSSDDVRGGSKRSNKGVLQNYLDKQPGEDEKAENGGFVAKSRPIADEFQNCTVLFADIAGE